MRKCPGALLRLPSTSELGFQVPRGLASTLCGSFVRWEDLLLLCGAMGEVGGIYFYCLRTNYIRAGWEASMGWSHVCWGLAVALHFPLCC